MRARDDPGGQNLTLARQPIHWHLVGDAQGQCIRNAAIHATYNRCVTVHGPNYLQIENKKARLKHATGETGAVMLIQRFSSALNANLHFPRAPPPLSPLL